MSHKITNNKNDLMIRGEMGRRPEPKRYDRRDRLILLMKSENIEGVAELSRIIEAKTGTTIAQQNLGQLIKDGDEFQNLTEERAREIINAFPNYRLAWLMGIDDFMTEDALIAYVLDAFNLVVPEDIYAPDSLKQIMDVLMRLMARMKRFDVSTDRMRAMQARKLEIDEPVVDGCYISRNQKSTVIPTHEWDSLSVEVCDFVEFKLQRIIDKDNPAQ